MLRIYFPTSILLPNVNYIKILNYINLIFYLWKIHSIYVSVVVAESLNCVWLFVTPWTVAHQASLSFTISWNMLKFMFVELVMLSNHLILCHSFFLLSLILPSIRVFSSESALHITWPKEWSFSVSISPSNEYSGLISVKIDEFDLLAVQGSLKSLLQHHS